MKKYLQRLWLYWKYMVCAMLLVSCEQETEICPECDWVHTEVIGNEMGITIESQSPEITYVRYWGERFTITKDFYECARIEIIPGESITFTDKYDCIVIVR